MKLLYTKRSPYARKAHVIALEKKIPLELIEENLMQKSDLLLKANPLGKIPALILNDGAFWVDSPVICQYLDGLKKTPVLIPNNKNARIHALHLEAIADGLMDITVAAFMEKKRHPDNFNKEFIDAQYKTIDQTLNFLEKNINEYKKFNIASIATACAIGYLNFRLGELNPKGKYPKLQAWFEKISKMPSMQKTVPIG